MITDEELKEIEWRNKQSSKYLPIQHSHTDIPLLIETVRELKKQEEKIKKVVKIQSQNSEIWFRAEKVSEGYLQAAIRHLHKIIEE